MRFLSLVIGLGFFVLLGGKAHAQAVSASTEQGEVPSLPQPEAAPAAPLPPLQTLPRRAPPAPAPPSQHPPPPPAPSTVRARLPAPEPGPGAYLHNGFYLQLGLGAGYVTESIVASRDGEAVSSRDFAGVSVPIDLAVGGTLGGGFVLGGVLHTMLLGRAERSNLPMPASELGDEHAATLSVLGLFGDWYPDPRSGFHVQGMIGGGSLLLSDTADSDYTATGMGASIGIGHAWWIGPEASFGILGRVDWASLIHDEEDPRAEYEHELLHVGVMGTVTYH